MILSHEEYVRVMETMPVACIDCVVRNDHGEYLLVKRDNEPLKGEYWVPGGRLHKGERLEEAVRRKMRQEIGVDVEIIENLGFFEEFFDKTAQDSKGGFHAVSFLFLVRPLQAEIRLDNQSSDWGWFAELPARLREQKYLKLENL
ncbi:MAG TPA: NUDIX hydrolase [Geobacter sp.]|nr:NUDIX hydrolase [Geobacter sp.]